MSRTLFELESGDVNGAVDLTCDSTLSDALRECRDISMKETGLEPWQVVVNDGKNIRQIAKIEMTFTKGPMISPIIFLNLA
jgi:hypothetical protein